MKNKNLIYWAVIILLIVIFLIFLYFLSFSNGNSDEIKITIKNQYSTSENIVLSGTAKSNCKITLLFAGKMGVIESNGNGSWIANLGKMPEGNYDLNVVADDSPTSRSVETAQLSVSSNKSSLSYLNNIYDYMLAGISGQLGSGATPDKLITVPINAPQVLSGSWKLMK